MTCSHIVFKVMVSVTFTLLSFRPHINFIWWFPGSTKIQSVLNTVWMDYVYISFRKIVVLSCRSEIKIGVQNDGELLY